MKFFFQVIITLLLTVNAVGQSTSVKDAFKKGKTTGYIRSFFMATQNEGDLQDWNALAIGGFLKYQTSSYYGFSFGAAFYNSMNLGISDITVRDAQTNKESRYESGLFDVNDLTNREVSILGELYLKYQNNGHNLTIGRYKLKTPFLNPEDGRMIPTLEQGVWYNYLSSTKKWSVDATWITHIAARSTSEFMSTGRSVGSYPQGKNPDGSNSNYKGNVHSAGLGIVAFNYKDEHFGFKAYDYHFDNVFNMPFVEGYVKFGGERFTHKISGQYGAQFKMGNGGNEDPTKAYVHDDLAQVIGAQYQIKLPKGCIVSGNWNYITDNGRFLFPREWGREFFFVFQKRERLEGAGNTQAWMIDIKREFAMGNQTLAVKIGYGQYLRPEANSFELNKYAFPANDQLNVDIFFYTRKDRKGLVIEWLTSYKGAIGNTFENPNFIINKVNMINHNIVLNYLF